MPGSGEVTAKCIPSAPPFSPTRMVEVDLGQPLLAIDGGVDGSQAKYGKAIVLVRLFTEPIGLVDVHLDDGEIRIEALAAKIWSVLGEQIADRTGRSDIPSLPELHQGPFSSKTDSYAQRRAELVAHAPSLSVVVCTRDRPERLARVLDALTSQEYPDFEIVVVDNAPTTDGVPRLLERLETHVPIRRIAESRPGLSWARNAGTIAAQGSIVAFIDDDEIADRHWLAELVCGFSAGDHVGCVSGTILPASLETEAEDYFEQYGGHSKGRGFEPLLFDTGANRRQHPLYPLPPFGAGGNMAFTKEALDTIGGFDTALGAGTATKGGEDTAAFSDVLLDGYQLAFRPAAVVWHHHYSDFAGLRTQLYGYGSGLTAYYTRLLLRRPRDTMTLVPLVATGVRDLLGSGSLRRETMTSSFPSDLLRAHRQGMLRGPLSYVRTVWSQRGMKDRGGL